MTPTVALVGASGYGRRHLAELLELHREGSIVVGAVVDVEPAAELPALFAASDASPFVTAGLGTALDHVGADAVVIATPPHTHAALAARALASGAAVYLEKPPVPLPSQLASLVDLAGGTRFEVGFQQTPGVVAAVCDVLAAHDLGPVLRVTGFGALQRPDAYYARARWAGRRDLEGAPVFDGALFNPLAHVLHAALAVARTIEPGWAMAELEAELGSVRPIQADDLAALRVRSRHGPLVTAVGTTAADRVVEPGLVVVAERASLRLRLRDLAASIVPVRHGASGAAPRPAVPVSVPREHRSALRQLVLDPRGAADPLLTGPAAEPFVRLVAAAVDSVTAPTPLGHLGRSRDHDADRWVELPGSTDAIDAAVAGGTMLGEQGVPVAAVRRAGLEEWNGLLEHPYDLDQAVSEGVST